MVFDRQVTLLSCCTSLSSTTHVMFKIFIENNANTIERGILCEKSQYVTYLTCFFNRIPYITDTEAISIP